MKQHILAKLQDERGASVTAESMIIIAFVVIIALTIFGLIANALRNKANQTVECINNSGQLLTNNENCN